MKIYGLTGGIGCGKSTVSRILQNYGFQIIDADCLTRDVQHTPEICRALADAFGRDILTMSPTGPAVNRKLLGNRVFASDSERAKLDQIMRPALKREAQIRLKACTAPAILDAALLFEAGWDDLTDENIVVLCPEEIRLTRIMSRDSLTKSAALARIRAQLSDAERIAHADKLIYNTGDISSIYRQIIYIFGHPASHAAY